MKKAGLHGFRIFRQESLSDTFSRVIQEQLDQSLQLSGHYHERPDYATHEIRKSTKRIRAVYRLFQQAAGEKLYHQGMEFFGNLSQILANHRLSLVYVEILKQCASDKKIPVGKAYLGRLITDLEKGHQHVTKEFLAALRTDQTVAGLLTTELKSDRLRLSTPCIYTDLATGLRKTYSRGKKCLEQAAIQPTTENFHELRKSTKALWNQLILIRPLWSAYYGIMVHHLDTLAEKLGLEHDIAELESRLQNEKNAKDSISHEVLLEYLAQRRKLLQKSIIPLAQRLYADKPGSVAAKMEVLYRMYLG